MEALNVLEEKLASLVVIVKRFKEENRQLNSNNEALKTENVKLAQNNQQLMDQLELAAKEGEELGDLYEERKLTKSVVDDLIKNIESLVEQEDQL